MGSRKPLSQLIENWENVARKRDDGGATKKKSGNVVPLGRDCPPGTGSRLPLKPSPQPSPGAPRADEVANEKKSFPDENVETRLEEHPPEASGLKDCTGTQSSRRDFPAMGATEIEGAVRRILRTELCSMDAGTVARGLAKLVNGCGGAPVPRGVEPAVRERYERVVRDYTGAVVKMNGDFLVLQAMRQHAQCIQVQTQALRLLARLTGDWCEETARAVASVISNVPGGFLFILRIMSDFIDCEDLQLAALATLLNVMLCDDSQWVGLIEEGLITSVIEPLLRHRDHSLLQRCGCNILCHVDNDLWLRTVADTYGGLPCVLHGLRVGVADVNLLFNGLGVLVHCCDKFDSGAAIIEGDGLSTVIAVMEHHGDDAGLQLAGLEALCLIAETDYETSLPHLVRSGGIQAIVRAMRVCVDQADVQYNGCSLLSILCQTQPYRSLVVRAGGRRVVSAACDANKYDDEVQRRACQVLEMLSTP